VALLPFFDNFNLSTIKAKTPHKCGVSYLNWRKRVGIEPTYDITATHQL